MTAKDHLSPRRHRLPYELGRRGGADGAEGSPPPPSALSVPVGDLINHIAARESAPEAKRLATPAAVSDRRASRYDPGDAPPASPRISGKHAGHGAAEKSFQPRTPSREQALPMMTSSVPWVEESAQGPLLLDLNGIEEYQPPIQNAYT